MGIKKLLIVCVILITVFLLFGCQSEPYEKPWPEFYVTDEADALLNSTKHWIVYDGLSLYEWSKDDAYYDTDIQGAQVVVLTSKDDPESVDTTEIFNRWGIGENDLGILIVVFYEDGDNGYPEFTSIVYEIGEQMSTYLSAFEADGMITDYFYDDSLYGDTDAMIINLYEETLYRIYDKIYDTTYTYDILDYLDDEFSDYGPLPSETDQSWFNLPTWAIVVIVIVLIMFGASGSGIFGIIGKLIGVKGNVSGGGRSGGYWFRR